jgi:hypothetical protein
LALYDWWPTCERCPDIFEVFIITRGNT